MLNGDILEFALATDDTALSVFEQFIDLAFPVDGEPIFDDRVLYLPGNHDHHLWETARERQYAHHIKHTPARRARSTSRGTRPRCSIPTRRSRPRC